MEMEMGFQARLLNDRSAPRSPKIHCIDFQQYWSIVQSGSSELLGLSCSWRNNRPFKNVRDITENRDFVQIN